MENIEKKCSRCKDSLPVGDFYKCKSAKDGLQNACKICNKKIVNEWQKSHRDEINIKIDRDKRKADLKSWYLKNKEKHKENVMAYNKEQYATDPFFRLNKELYRLVYRWLNAGVNNKYKVKKAKPKTANTFEMLGYTSEELRSHFKEAIDSLTLAGKRHRLSLVIKNKYFNDDAPVDVVFCLMNLVILDKDDVEDNEFILVDKNLYDTVIPNYIKTEYISSIINTN